MLSVKDFSIAFDVRRNTIRRWSKDYADFLSDSANPGEGETRRYTEGDAGVIALIADLRADNRKAEYIRGQLAAGRRGQWPPEGQEPQQDEPGSTEIPLTEKDKLIAELSRQAGYLEAVMEERDYLRGHVLELQDQVGDLKDQLRLLAAPKEESPPAADETEVIETPEETPAADDLGSGGEDEAAPVKLTRRQRLQRWFRGEGK